MKNYCGALFAFLVLLGSVHAADKIRVGYPAPVGNFLTLPLREAQRELGIK